MDELKPLLGLPLEPPDDVWGHALAGALEDPRDADDLAELVPIGDWVSYHDAFLDVMDGAGDPPAGYDDPAEVHADSIPDPEARDEADRPHGGEFLDAWPDPGAGGPSGTPDPWFPQSGDPADPDDPGLMS